ncbi:hypothetical protein [Leptospira noguchii]|uniref:Uncharacterized protein n=1 Tax=Leptospira noguchii TaxID=28182 RepID=A0AAE9GEI0_9LEPT|nr:hypothetical protein [Leptospira noguchii]UOG57425.1 hypothetical protein MAL03_04500 [Leptospira noguchii]
MNWNSFGAHAPHLKQKARQLARLFFDIGRFTDLACLSLHNIYTTIESLSYLKSSFRFLPGVVEY